MAKSGFDARGALLHWEVPSSHAMRRWLGGPGATQALAICVLFLPACVLTGAAAWFAYSVIDALISGVAITASIRCCRTITVFSQSPTFGPLLATWLMIGLACAVGAYALFQLAIGMLRGR